MKITRTHLLITAITALAVLAPASSLRAASPDSHNRRRSSRPRAGTAMTTAYVQMVGRMAYLWGWALVNSANRHAAFSKAPEPGLMGGVVPVAHNAVAMLTTYISAEQRFIAATNQDVVYGFGYLDNLDNEPIVFQVPDFGDRFWVYALYDVRTDELSNIGKQYGTKPGFYMVVGPNWKGATPTESRRCCDPPHGGLRPRVFMDDTAEDHNAIQPVLSQIVFYPLSQFDGKMKTKDWSKLPHFPAPNPLAKARPVGEPGDLLRRVAGGDEKRAAAAGRASPLPVDRQCAGGGRQGPEDQEDAEGNRRRG